MADPLSLAASIIAVLGLAWTSSQKLYEATESWVNAPQSIANIKNDLGAMKNILLALQKMLQDNHTPAVESVIVQMEVGSVLHNFKMVCDDFAMTIAKYTSHSTELRFAKRDKLKVSLGKSNIADFTERLGLCKETLSLVLHTATLAACTKMLDNTGLSNKSQQVSLNASQKALDATGRNIKTFAPANSDDEDKITTITPSESLATLNLRTELRKVYEVALTVTIRSEDFKLCLQSLFLTNPDDDLAAIHRLKGERISGTCEWLLVQKEYIQWLNGDSSKLLRLVGAPGIGKTMISSFLVDAFKKSAPETVLAFHFCDSKDEKRNTAIGIIRTIIFQLLRQNPALFRYIQQDYEQMKDRLCSSFDTLWRILRQILTESVVPKMYILIDALDECEKSSREDLLGGLENLLLAERNLNVILLITHRPEPDISRHLRDVSTRLKIDSGKINTDLSKFIQVKVDELSKKKKFGAPLKQEIKDALHREAEGTFLWASLVLRDISRTTSTHHVRPKLGDLPSGLSAVYNRILSNIDEEDESDARFIFRCVIGARRPLSQRELAMAHSLGPQGWNKTTLPTEELLDELQDGFRCCEALLHLDPVTHSINLIHQSAKEYLLGKGDRLQNSDLSQYLVEQAEANLLIFKICWRYLSMEEFDKGALIIMRNTKNELIANSLSDTFLDAHCFLRYAIREWREHASAASSSLIANSGWAKDNLGRLPTFRDAWLHTAVKKGDETIVELLLCNDANVEAREVELYSQTALHLAVKGGCDGMVNLLLNHNADVDARRFPDSQTPLHLAAQRGYRSIVDLLVNHKADTNARDEDGWTPLHLAVERGCQSVVKLLIENGADVRATDDEGQTAIHWAAERGQEKIVRILLESQVDVTKRDHRNRTALDIAVERGNKVIIDLLVQYETEVSSTREFDGQTPLHRAVDSGSEMIVELLVNRGADIEARNRQNRTPLYLAVENGHYRITRFLLSHGADVNTNGNYNVTPLHRAAEGGNRAIVTLLLNYEADINAKDNTMRTALHFASSMGYSDVVKLLLQNEADSNATDKEGRTALDMALEYEHEKVVELLIPFTSGPE